MAATMVWSYFSLQPIDVFSATEGDDGKLINKTTGLCVACAASGTLTHTAFSRIMYAKGIGPVGVKKHYHARDATRKSKFSYDFPSGPIGCGSQSCGACSNIAHNLQGTYICNWCETHMNATVTKTSRLNCSPCGLLASKLADMKQTLWGIMKTNSMQAGLPHQPFHVGMTKVHTNINYCIMW